MTRVTLAVSDYVSILKATTPRSAKGMRQALERSGDFLRNLGEFYRITLRDVPEPQPVVSRPGPLKTEAKGASENAYKRAMLFWGGASILLSDHRILKVKWLDAEVPAETLPQGRRQCLDLIGETPGGEFVLAELKAAGGESPFHGLYQLLRYSAAVRKHIEKRIPLASHPDRPSYWERYRDAAYLVLAAPDSYWLPWSRPPSSLDIVADAARLATSACAGRQRIVLSTFSDVRFKEQPGYVRGRAFSPAFPSAASGNTHPSIWRDLADLSR